MARSQNQEYRLAFARLAEHGLAQGARSLFEAGLNNGLDPMELDLEICAELGLCEWGLDLENLFNGEEVKVPVWYTESTYGYGIKI